MARSLIRKNQLHPDIADLISGYGDTFFITPEELAQALINLEEGLPLDGIVYTSGNQNINGVKNFIIRPTLNGAGLATLEDLVAGGGGAEYVFPSNLTVTLGAGKTFGKYQNGNTIFASGKTTSEVIRMAISEAINPDVNLSSPTTSIPFNQTNISNVLNFSYVIRSASPATVSSVSLQWKRANEVNWNTLPINTASTTFTHITTNSLRNTQTFNYRYIVTDSENATTTKTLDIPVTAYVAPTVSNINIGTSPALLGSVSTTLAGTINRNTPLTSLTNYQLQYSVTSNVWVNIGTVTSITSTPFNFSVNHNDTTLRNNTNISYRIRVTDNDANGPIQTTDINLGTRNFLYGNYFGYSSATSLTTVTQIETLGNLVLSDSRSRTVNNVTAGAGLYTYYAYKSDAGDLTSIVQDGATTIFINGAGAFTKQSNVPGTNTNGANVTYILYRSNAPQAFTNNTLAFN